MSDLLELLILNPQIQQFLTSLGLTTAREAGQRIGKWVVDSIAEKVKKSKLLTENRMRETEKLLTELVSEKKMRVTPLANYWINFLAFMFPDREATIDKLTKADCDYIAQRIFTGLGFQQLVLDVGYGLEKMRYMTHFIGVHSRAFHYFDLTASYEQEYFDNFLCARVIDIHVSSPQDFVNSLPTVVGDINGDVSRPPILRDHDIIPLVMANRLSSNALTKLRHSIRTVQEKNDIILPRLVLVSNQELLELLSSKNIEERKKRMKRKFEEVRLYRGG